VALAALVYGLWPKPIPLPEHKHVVVLPLRSIGGDADQAALCDGLTETLTTALTQTGLMSVVPASDVRDIDTVKDARRAFGVNLVLYGSLQRRSDRLRLTINLADADGDRQLGVEVVDGPADQPLQIEDAMIEKVASLVDIAAPAGPAGRPSTPPTPGAYDAYLRGRGFLYRYDRPGNLERALHEFDEAIRADSRFALGYAGLAESQLMLYRQRRDPAVLEASKTAALKALSLNPALATAKVTYGAAMAESGQTDAAIASLEQAIDIDPRNPTAYRQLALVYQKTKRFDRAEDIYKKAIRARPGEWLSYMNLATFYAGRQRYADAEPFYRKAIELSPDNHLPYRNLGAMLIALGRNEEAESLLLKARSLNPTARAASNLGTLYMLGGRYQEAVPILEQAADLAPKEVPNEYRIWGNLGDAYWLSGAPEDADPGLPEGDRGRAAPLATDPTPPRSMRCSRSTREAGGQAAGARTDSDGAQGGPRERARPLRGGEGARRSRRRRHGPSRIEGSSDAGVRRGPGQAGARTEKTTRCGTAPERSGVCSSQLLRGIPTWQRRKRRRTSTCRSTALSI
jgi:serine/threonine-protein kinase